MGCVEFPFAGAIAMPMFADWIYRLRSWLLARFGITSEKARKGVWWEADLLLVIVAGLILWGLVGLFLA